MYYFRMLVSNLHNKPVLLKWSSPDTGIVTHSRTIPAYYFKYVVFSNVESYEKPAPVELSSYVNGSTVKLYTNDQQIYSIQPVRERRPAFYNVYISTYITASNTTMLFTNPTSNDMVVTWKTRGYKDSTTVPAKSQSYRVPVTISGGFRNQNVIIAAKTTEGEEVLINSDENVITRLPHNNPFIIDFHYKDIIFNNTLSSDVTVTGHPGGIVETVSAASHVSFRILMKKIPDNGVTFTAVNNLDQSSTTINGEPSLVVRRDYTVTRMQIGAREQIARQYFIKLWLVNNHTNNVALRWKEKDWQRLFEVKPNYNGETVLSFNSDDPVTLTGLDITTNNNVYLNRRQELSLRPTSDVKYATNVVISGEIALYDYFYRLIVNNERNTDVNIILKSSQETTTTTVPSLNFKYAINTPLFNIEAGPKQSLQISAVMRDGTPLYVNGKDAVKLLPTLNDDEATVVNIGKEIPRRLFYYSFQVASPVSRDVILRYTLADGVSRLTRIPAPSKDRKGYYRVSIPYKNLARPTPVAFYAYQEDNNKAMLINGVKSYTVLPDTDQNNKQVVYVTDTDRSGVLPATDGNSNTYKFQYKAQVFNPNSEEMTVKWIQNNKPQTVRIPANSNRDISFTATQYGIKEALPIEMRAFSSINVMSFSLNQLPVFHLKAATDGKPTPVLYIGHIGEVLVYVTNKFDVDVDVTRQIGDDIKTFTIMANTQKQKFVMKNPKADSRHIYTAVSSLNKRPLAVNKERRYSVNPRSLKTNLNGQIVLNLDVTGLTIYYALKAKNTELYPVNLVWNINGQSEFRRIGGGYVTRLVIQNDNPASPKPQPITLSAYRLTRVSRVNLHIDNQKTYKLHPVYDPRDSDNVVISSNIKAVPQNHIRLNVINFVNEDVKIYWSQNSDSDIDVASSTDFKRISSGANKEIRLTFPYEKEVGIVKLAAVTTTNGEFMVMNNRYSLYLQPTEKPRVVRVVITKRG